MSTRKKDGIPVARDEDLIDTAKVVMAPDHRSEVRDVVALPQERSELVIAPDEVMDTPSLTLRGDPDVLVEQLACGPFVIFASPGRVEDYYHGVVIKEKVSPKCPLRVLLKNLGAKKCKITATLSVSLRAGAYSIVNRE